MGGDKIEYTKQAVQYAINHFTPSDIASLTVFDNEVQVLYPAREVEFKDEFKGVDKLIRIVKVMSLINSRQGATLRFLANECGVCERTVYRDIDALAQGEL